MKIKLAVLLFLAGIKLQAQELFVYTEPASNMAAKAVGVRLNTHFITQSHPNAPTFHLVPEIMAGVSKKLMLHSSAFLHNSSNKFGLKGGMVYAKYRFLSIDDVHSHFRMAAYAKASLVNGFIHKRSVDLTGDNSGYEAGIISTKLVHKFAASASVSWLHAADNPDYKFLYGNKNRDAVGFTVSTGLLLLPKEYSSYKQTNMNVMLECLGQVMPNSGYIYTDLAPSVQFIFNSQARIDLGYRFTITENLPGLSENSFLVRLEYNFFNALK